MRGHGSTEGQNLIEKHPEILLSRKEAGVFIYTIGEFISGRKNDCIVREKDGERDGENYDPNFPLYPSA